MVRAKIEGDLNFMGLAKAVSIETGRSAAETQEIVQATLDVIGRTLAAGYSVKLTNAFTLSPSRRRVAKGALGGRVTRSHYVKTVRFHLNGRLHDAIRSGHKVTTLKKATKSY
jgi:nucleoid DNA-binding protein